MKLYEINLLAVILILGLFASFLASGSETIKGKTLEEGISATKIVLAEKGYSIANEAKLNKTTIITAQRAAAVKEAWLSTEKSPMYDLETATISVYVKEVAGGIEVKTKAKVPGKFGDDGVKSSIIALLK